ncbi:MAG TPA: dephospho-CoA kinase [Chitinophagaceae bacterium]|nr:dephospho-CoA kinase [Chitinophagaceae bacterium]
MIRVGLTGGIGSGKSTVAKILEVLGIPVYYADEAARRLMNQDPGLVASMRATFGDQAYRDGQLDRAYIAQVVFSQPSRLEQLNALVHPAVMRDAEIWMSGQTAPYAIHEAALIFEAGVDRRLDFVIGVTAPQQLRIQRVMNRDRCTREEVLGRIRQQMDEQEKMNRCQAVLHNDETSLLTPQVLDLHAQLLLRAAQPPENTTSA